MIVFDAGVSLLGRGGFAGCNARLARCLGLERLVIGSNREASATQWLACLSLRGSPAHAARLRRSSCRAQATDRGAESRSRGHPIVTSFCSVFRQRAPRCFENWPLRRVRGRSARPGRWLRSPARATRLLASPPLSGSCRPHYSSPASAGLRVGAQRDGRVGAEV
jgi:hypothetical protein